MCSSSPPTPKKGEDRFRSNTTPCECVEDYYPGTYHPTHLGDVFKDGRYKVIRKLGYGGCSTVWLVSDQECCRFVAVKILTANSSKESRELQILEHFANLPSTIGVQHVTMPLDHFWHQGPNGCHLCLVFELMGPSANSMLEDLPQFQFWSPDVDIRYPMWMAKSLLRQVLQGLVYLHDNGVVHGDFQPGNMLFALKNLNVLNQAKLGQDDDYKNGSISTVERLDGKVDKWAPRYLAVPQPLDEYANIGPDFVVKLSDFGGAFFRNDPPKKILTPTGLRAPETSFGTTYDENLDIWAFGCLVFEFITGTPLFIASGYGNEKDDDDDHLLQLSNILGPLPDDVFSRWTRSAKYFDANRVQFNSYLDEELPESIDPLGAMFEPLEQFFDSLKPAEMANDEANDVKCLLRQTLQYDATKRPTAKQILQNPWFASQGSERGVEDCSPVKRVSCSSSIEREEPTSSDIA